ncbi:DGQHR domain-containing protein [Parathalassolituus penaei]|uniref:DGQHR domain-containing protein n=1 Tax=Parathalassolituus penaei TaxID=2997323 RepID=A0A9X3ITJ5_9GAMM|nr:DGQHR domain-containing protein [Parathalassolituus penaei]MCY0966380.1 DGQHR domain-containing protein [Parathalassolituus penaei]
MTLERTSFGSVSLVRQGDHTFYSLTLPSELLAETCFVVSRDEDPKEGFQRELDEKRAREIAAYIDSGLGTIPSSIVLSAQDDAEVKYDSKRKSISFLPLRKAFLIIDGQHRVFGFMHAKKAFRVPVVIYDGLSKRDETRLFIDINSKQKGVPPELLLDIKKLAEYENDQEEFLRGVFDTFLQESDSCLFGKLSPASKSAGKITRSTFNTAIKPLVKIFGGKDVYEIYQILNSYFLSFDEGVLIKHDLHEQIYNTTVFKAICGLFPVIAAKVKDRFGAIYTADNFYYFMDKAGNNIKPAKIRSPGQAYKPLVKYLEECLKEDFQL